MGKPSKAWLLTPYGVQPFAVAGHEIIEYLNVAQLHAVPTTPAHCRAAIFWRNRIVPLLDFGPLNGLYRTSATPSVAVLAYQVAPGTPLDYIAIALLEPPVKIDVDDETACDLPQEQATLWSLLVASCFSREGMATPIVSVVRLDSAEFRLYVEKNGADVGGEAPPVAPVNGSRVASGMPVAGKAVSGDSALETALEDGGADLDADVDDEIEDADLDTDAEWEDSDDLGDDVEDEDEDEDEDSDDLGDEADDEDEEIDTLEDRDADAADEELEDDDLDADDGQDDFADETEDEDTKARNDLDADLDAAFDADDSDLG